MHTLKKAKLRKYIKSVAWKIDALEGERSDSLTTRKYCINIFYGDNKKYESQAKNLIIWGKDEGKEMGFHGFTFTIILWSSSLEKEAFLLVDEDCLKRTLPL